MEAPLINRVANSPIITLDLAQYLPRVSYQYFDIKDYLWQGLILKEKDFRTAMKEGDWSKFEGKVGLIICSADAIIPQWAYALISTTLSNYTEDLFVGSQEEYIKAHYLTTINYLDVSEYRDRPMILKGCGDTSIPAEAFSRMAMKLKDVAKSVMYGEACSAVPIYKKPKK